MQANIHRFWRTGVVAVCVIVLAFIVAGALHGLFRALS